MRLELAEYDFTVEYLKGKDNYVADALSRITIKDLQNITGNITENKDSMTIQYKEVIQALKKH